MSIARHIRRFTACRDGTILVLWGMSMAVFFGIVALSFDIGRMASTQSELQSFADNVALAAAGELDGGTTPGADAITRAQAAAANLISDTQSFGNGGRTLSGAADYTLTFHSDLPANDQNAMTSLTTDPAQAVYARVVATPQTVDLTFAAAFAALTGNPAVNSTVGAEAVAGFTTYACDITPMFMCIPPGWRADANVGQGIRLRTGGSGSWGPGNFGWLDLDAAAAQGGPCDGLNGANLDRCLLGAEGSVTRCFAQRGVTTDTGQRLGLTSGPFNTRFDMYGASISRNNPLYPPAPNVIKGRIPQNPACNGTDPSPDTTAMPPDDCFASSTCSPDAAFGNGVWSSGRTTYVATNYGTTDPHSGATTRWQYFQAENAVAGNILNARAETGRPTCSPHASTDGIHRRTFVVAGIDCSAVLNGKTYGVPVEEWVRVFILQPVGVPPTFDIYGEVVESVSSGSGAGGSATVHDVVQLYR